jgi:peptide/nickel transport system ATP-binding protein
MHLAKSLREVDKKVFRLMNTVGLSARLVNSYPHELDGGRRQRVGIARALAVDPKFIVCDEPVSALDVSIQAQILNLLMDLQDEMGLTYLFITHSLSVVKHISDDIMVMYLGKCVEKAPDLDHKISNLILGEVTSPINPPPGCRFASRCLYKTEKCLGTDLQLVEVSSGHFVECVLHEKSSI